MRVIYIYIYILGGIQRLRQKTLQQGRGVRSRALTTTSSLLPPSCWVTARVFSLSLSFTPRLLSLPFGRPVLGRACTRVRSCAGARDDANSARRHAHLHACTHTNQRTRTHARTHAARAHAPRKQLYTPKQPVSPSPPTTDPLTHARARAQLVARVETQIRLRDGWLAEVEAARSNALLGQATKFSHTKTMILYGCHLTIHVPLLGQATIVAHKSTIMFCADNSSFHGCNGAGGNVIIQQYTHHCARISTRSNPRLDDVFSRGSIVMLRSD